MVPLPVAAQVVVLVAALADQMALARLVERAALPARAVVVAVVARMADRLLPVQARARARQVAQAVPIRLAQLVALEAQLAALVRMVVVAAAATAPRRLV